MPRDPAFAVQFQRFFAPRGTPAPIVARLEKELVQIAQSAEMKDQLMRQGMEPLPAGSAELGKLVRSEVENYRAVFKTAGIRME